MVLTAKDEPSFKTLFLLLVSLIQDIILVPQFKSSSKAEDHTPASLPYHPSSQNLPQSCFSKPLCMRSTTIGFLLCTNWLVTRHTAPVLPPFFPASLWKLTTDSLQLSQTAHPSSPMGSVLTASMQSHTAAGRSCIPTALLPLIHWLSGDK